MLGSRRQAVVQIGCAVVHCRWLRWPGLGVRCIEAITAMLGVASCAPFGMVAGGRQHVFRVAGGGCI